MGARRRGKQRVATGCRPTRRRSAAAQTPRQHCKETAVNRISPALGAFRHAAIGAALLAMAAFAPLSAIAQGTSDKPAPRLGPNQSQIRSIPAGVDTGSPVTSNALPLGTPVPSSSGDVRTQSAAARAAARPDPLTRKGVPSPPAPIVTDDVKRDASRPLTEGTATTKASTKAPTKVATKARAARVACPSTPVDAKAAGGEPVALPDSGFVGSSASPQTAAQVARGAARTDCP
jgi:hypothetical protein